MRGPLLITTMASLVFRFETGHSDADQHAPLAGMLRYFHHRFDRCLDPSFALRSLTISQFNSSGISLGELLGNGDRCEIGQRFIRSTRSRRSQLKPARHLLVGFQPVDLVRLDFGCTAVDANQENVVKRDVHGLASHTVRKLAESIHRKSQAQASRNGCVQSPTPPNGFESHVVLRVVVSVDDLLVDAVVGPAGVADDLVDRGPNPSDSVSLRHPHHQIVIFSIVAAGRVIVHPEPTDVGNCPDMSGTGGPRPVDAEQVVSGRSLPSTRRA